MVTFILCGTNMWNAFYSFPINGMKYLDKYQCQTIGTYEKETLMWSNQCKT